MENALTPQEAALLKRIEKLGKPSLLEKDLTKEERQTAHALLAQGRLVRTHKNRLALPSWTGLVRGTVQGTTRGYVFVLPDEAGLEDLFISERDRDGLPVLPAAEPDTHRPSAKPP